MPLERPVARPPSLRQVVSAFSAVHGANAVVAFTFAASGPVAIVLAIGTRGGLGPSEIASWLFSAFFVNGLISIAFCWLYRQPLVLLWSIPGSVLVGPALGHLTFREVIGAFLATGVLMLLLGGSGWVRRAMEAIPMPVVMGMVAGVFLRFGLDLVHAVHEQVWVAAPMTAVFLAVTAVPALGRRLPPLLAAMAVGIVMIVVLGEFHPSAGGAGGLARPTFYTPAFSWAAMVELVVPLAVTVLVVQNGQGIAVLRAAGHQPPIDAITVACGAGSMVTACLGGVSTCLTGPVNAIISATEDKRRQYTAGMAVGVLACVFGLLSPAVARVMLGTPRAFIAALAGLAMLRVLQSAFAIAFGERHTLGALVAFLVTVADVGIVGIGAPFWGLVLGAGVAALLERGGPATRDRQATGSEKTG